MCRQLRRVNREQYCSPHIIVSRGCPASRQWSELLTAKGRNRRACFRSWSKGRDPLRTMLGGASERWRRYEIRSFWYSFLGLHQGSMDRHASIQLKKENAGTGTVVVQRGIGGLLARPGATA